MRHVLKTNFLHGLPQRYSATSFAGTYCGNSVLKLLQLDWFDDPQMKSPEVIESPLYFCDYCICLLSPCPNLGRSVPYDGQTLTKVSRFQSS